MKKILSYVLILSAVLATTACGWHLRGQQSISGVDSVHVSSGDSGTAFAQELKYHLKRQGVELKANAPEARYSVVVLKQKSERRVASVGASARATEYLLVETVEFLVLDPAGQQLLPATTLRAERSLDFDENQVIGKNDEAALIQTELRNDLVRQLSRRLQHLNPAAAAADNEG
ncbi:LPS assembly lipoprotein LptE [Porticoccaceae bacterium LTM1]|nr:LPS assembly lipoprotein LptE [Porticoccaceae bacterium LTM1]